MVKRRELREQEKEDLHILLKDGDQPIDAILINVSKTGMSVKIERVLPTYKVVDIFVKIDQKKVHLKGSVRWVNEYPDQAREKLNEVGIALKDPPPEYLKHFTEDDHMTGTISSTL